MSAPLFAAYGVANGIVATAGIAAVDPATMRPRYADFDAQAHWVLDQLDKVLGEAGASRQNLLRLDCFLTDRCWFGDWNSCYAKHFGDNPPARSTLICGLPINGLLIEVQAIAAIPHHGRNSAS